MSAESAPSAVPSSASSQFPAFGSASFAGFSALGERISATTSKLKKIAELSTYLRSLPPAELSLAAIYLTGQPFAQAAGRTLQVGGAIIWRALRTVSRLGEQQFRDLSRQHADAGKTTYEALLDRTTPEPFSLPDAAAFFAALQQARGPALKTELVQDRIARLSPLEASYVVRILTGDLRIGLKTGLVEEALAAAFEVSPEEIREAHMLTGDLGETAVRAKNGTLSETVMRFFHPIQPMLASPESSAEAIWTRIASATAWAEDKYDGIRAQVHIAEGRVEIFTRDLRRATGQFADLVRAAAAFPRSAILDGEILAHDQTRRLTFFDLQKRLGRKTEDDLFLGASDIPVVFRAFDLLALDGAPLLKRPLSERRASLETLTLPPSLEVAPIRTVTSAAEVDAAFAAARASGNEGLMIKDATSLYTPGRRGLAWLKLKKELATLDVVVVGAEQGHGRRSHVLSDYTFAVRDDATGALLTIGKAYSGLTDEEIEQLTEHFTNTTIGRQGRVREVRPEIVLEIAFDSVQRSDRHASGLALRFPRIKAIRRDKSPAQIDTLSYAQSLVQ
jgi:DNA ligase-1